MMSENGRGDKRRRKSSQHKQKFSKEGQASENSQSHGPVSAPARTASEGRASKNSQSHGRQAGAGQNIGGHGGPKKTGKEQGKNDKGAGARPKWTAAKLRSDPIPSPLCVYCEKPIKELASALTDSNGEAIHFECVQKRIAAMESLGKDDTVTYIGGGRFGVVHFGNSRGTGKFTIKKIIEWEQKDKRAPWRGHIADHFSLT